MEQKTITEQAGERTQTYRITAQPHEVHEGKAVIHFGSSDSLLHETEDRSLISSLCYHFAHTLGMRVNAHDAEGNLMCSESSREISVAARLKDLSSDDYVRKYRAIGSQPESDRKARDIVMRSTYSSL